MKKNKLYYIAGPYSSNCNCLRAKRERYHSFMAAEMLKSGYLVYSPIAETAAIARYGHLTDTAWESWRDKDLLQLSRCDGLILLDICGLSASRGTRGEVKYCLTNNIPIYFYKNGRLYKKSETSLLKLFNINKVSELND